MCKKLNVVFGLFCCLVLPFSANAVVVLQYHHVSNETPKITSTSPELFEQHLEYLDKNNFDIIGLGQLADLVRKGKPLPDKTVVITFDDGYISVYKEAYPRLKKRGFPFAVFINTQPHNSGNPQFMSWRQLKEMSEEGVVFANHTVSHPHLIRRADNESISAWRKRVRREIKTAEDTIRKQLQQRHKLFAYPFGEYNSEVKQLLAEKGYLAFAQHSGPLSVKSDRQALPRFAFGGDYGGIDDFATKVNTLPMPLREVAVHSEKGTALMEPELPSGVKHPRLILVPENPDLAKQVNCFASGQGRIPVTVADSSVTAQAPKELPAGRSRYNCTAPAGEAGRFFWYTQPFIRREAGGVWYEE